MRNVFFVLVGPSGAGKTYLINRLLEKYPSEIGLVQSTTTRPWRDPTDDTHYRFVSRKEFKRLIEERCFIEYDSYLGHYYGLEWRQLEEVVKERHAIMALTPRGAIAVQDRVSHISVVTFLITASEAILRKNLKRRGVDDEEAIARKIHHAFEFTLPQERYTYRIEMKGDETDFPSFEELVVKEMQCSPKV